MPKIYTTFALINNHLPSGVIDAIKINCENTSINEIHVVTESEVSKIITKYPSLTNPKIKWSSWPQRPTFGDMLDVINQGFCKNESTVSILLNADISIPDIKTTIRLSKAMDAMGAERPKTIFSLTRHDMLGGEAKLLLKSGLGFPNTISSDAWVFSSVINCKKDLYYSLGQMFCDKFFNHDLITSGYVLYNPCVDSVVVHHEEHFKDNEYYRSLSNSEESQDSIKRHWRNSVTNDGNYYGIPSVKSVSLAAGYRPKPISFHASRKKIIIFLNSNQSNINSFFNKLFSSIDHTDLSIELYLVIESPESYDYIELVLAKKSIQHNVYITLVSNIDDIIKNLFEGIHDSFDSIMLTKNPEIISESLVSFFGSIFLDYRFNEVNENINLKPDCSPFIPAIDGENIKVDFCPFVDRATWIKLDDLSLNHNVYKQNNIIVFIEYGNAKSAALVNKYNELETTSFLFGKTGFVKSKIGNLEKKCPGFSIETIL